MKTFEHCLTAGVLALALALLAPLASAQDRPGTPPGDRRPPSARRGDDGEPGRRPFADAVRDRGQDWMERMRAENPEEFERLRQLREQNPEQFREEVRGRVRERLEGNFQARLSPPERECTELSRQFHEAATPEAKEQLKGRIEAAVDKAFDARLAQQKEMLANMEKQLRQLREEIEAREQNKAAVCTRRVDELTADPRLRW
ncbi:MAG: hypothetical protein BWZ02_01114 [Lentisphaerae bacterium ADurb.BinA184]|nr:MAG: hypothetical protein BWZ02_01114 [Lentisphaerae bacterium ADurb.BinA184]